MKGIDPPHTTFAEEIICDAVFWNPVPNATDWYILMIKKWFIMIRLNQVLITGLKINRIDEMNICNRKQATNLDTMKVDDNDICEIIESVHRRDKFDIVFDIDIVSECEYNEGSSENEEESSGENDNKEYDEIRQRLMVVIFYYMNIIQK